MELAKVYDFAVKSQTVYICEIRPKYREMIN